MRQALALSVLALTASGVGFFLLSRGNGEVAVERAVNQPLPNSAIHEVRVEDEAQAVPSLPEPEDLPGPDRQLDDLNADRRAVVLAGPSALEPSAASKPDDATDIGARLVSFRAKPSGLAEVKRVNAATLWLARVDAIDTSSERYSFDEVGADVLLVPGDYIAALGEAGGDIMGASESFSVAGKPLTVFLSTEFSFEFNARLLEVGSLEPLRAVTLKLDRVGPHSKWKDRSLLGTSDDQGFLKVPLVSPGRWRIRLTREGYVSLDQETDLPWSMSQETQVRREGVLSLGDVHLKPFTPIQFQLVGAESWSDLSKFRIAHTHLGEPVAFDGEGHATLSLGYYAEPIYLKLWYPDDRMAVFYLNNGVPEPHEVQLITVGGKQTLEVDLQIADAVLDELEQLNCGVRVAFRTRGGEDKFVARDVLAQSGVFEFTAVQSPFAMINFVTTNEGELPVDWATYEVAMRPDGRTTATLVVERAPRALQFRDQDGQPMKSVSYRMHQSPNRTSWAIGGTTGEDGIVRVPTLSEADGLVTAWTDGDSDIAFDVPVNLSQTNSDPHLVLDGGTMTFVEVLRGDEPQEGVWLNFVLAKSGTSPIGFPTDVNGRTHAFHLHPASQAEVLLDDTSLWAPDRQVPLRPGRNVFRVWKKGELRVESLDELTSIRSMEFGVDVQTWFESGRAPSRSISEGGFSLHLPTGIYLHSVGPEQTVEIEIRAGQLLDLR